MSSHLLAMAYISKERVAERRQSAEAYRQARRVSKKKTSGRSFRKLVKRGTEAGIAFLFGGPDKPTQSQGSLGGPVEVGDQ